jgi:hypothetical protein
MNFDPKRAAEAEIFTVDFGPRLAAGVTISSPVWSLTPVNGADPNVGSMIIGTASVSGSTSSQIIGGGVPGLRYAPTCTVQTSDGQTLIEPQYGQGYLQITL